MPAAPRFGNGGRGHEVVGFVAGRLADAEPERRGDARQQVKLLHQGAVEDAGPAWYVGHSSCR